MINKFQQGGSQLLALVKFVQELAKVLKVNSELIALVVQLDPNILNEAFQVFELTKDINLAAQAFVQEIQKRTRTARHGAKLNYLKSLKHQCADDEELVYYKKGGAVNCGCKKKEVGGPIKKDNSLDARNKFIAKYRTKKEQAKIDSLSEADYNQGKSTTKDERTAEQKMSDAERLKKLKVSKKSCGGSAVAKFKTAKCGSKLKKHELGGSLKSIPFMQKGSSFKKAWNIEPYKSNFSLPNEEDVIVGPNLILPGLLPEVTITRPDRRLRFDRRENNIGGGRKVISEALYDYYDGGDTYLGDLATTPAGRVIYTSPYGNDTLYYNKNYKFIPGKGWTQTGNSRYIEYPHGAMLVADKNDPLSKKVWKYLIKNKNIISGTEPGEKEAFNRAKKEK